MVSRCARRWTARISARGRTARMASTNVSGRLSALRSTASAAAMTSCLTWTGAMVRHQGSMASLMPLKSPRWRHLHHTRPLPLFELRQPEPVHEGEMCQGHPDRPRGADRASHLVVAQPGDNAFSRACSAAFSVTYDRSMIVSSSVPALNDVCSEWGVRSSTSTNLDGLRLLAEWHEVKPKTESKSRRC